VGAKLIRTSRVRSSKWGDMIAHCSALENVRALGDESIECAIALGLIAYLDSPDGALVARDQRAELSDLLRSAGSAHYLTHPAQLFANDGLLQLGEIAAVARSEPSAKVQPSQYNPVSQLLVPWIHAARMSAPDASTSAIDCLSLGSLDLLSRSPYLSGRTREALHRMEALTQSKVSQFSRSAHYMGSKAALAPFLNEILHTLAEKDTVVVDLMCGSGAAAGAFSRNWRTLASDAQMFSRVLAVVQGGGMTADRAHATASQVMDHAREHFHSLPDTVVREVETERRFLTAEPTTQTLSEFSVWMNEFPRIGSSRPAAAELDGFLSKRRRDPTLGPYLMCYGYYANLFLGVRQATEVDSIRFGIDQIKDPVDRTWALGALLCAVSTCAYTYGGHFAQPKLDASKPGKVQQHARAVLVQRGMSVSHEFFVRFVSLAEESVSASHAIEPVSGPWLEALDRAGERIGSAPACVYLDPPYTRDEYSRYYHVLEALARYDYPAVHGKASIPKPNEGGRFSSPFSTRSVEQVESLLATVISACLARGWSCLWSYSSSGVASVTDVIRRVCNRDISLKVFSMNHMYKAQGRHAAKSVKEYAVYFSN
jgi:adenine-specific DNA-methyltransferase